MSTSKHILRRVRGLIENPDYRPLNKSEFARELGVSPKDRALLRKALGDLVSSGVLHVGKKARYVLSAPEKDGDRVTGHVQFSRGEKRSAVTFLPENPGAVPELKHEAGPGFPIPRRYQDTALDGDRVAVRLIKREPQKWHRQRQPRKPHPGRSREPRYEAQIVEILQRGLTQFVGTYHRRGHSAVISPEDSKLPPTFQLEKVLPGASPGDMIVAEFVAWTDPKRPPLARMTEVLGRPDAPGVDMMTVIRRHRLPLEFPREVLAEADRIEETIPESVIASREDWREREVFTIDPEDARDFDDAISVIELPDRQGWELAVHIADVSHYVKPGSALDREAKKRGNSVYLADRVIPMLPEKLSNGVCSLNPHVERLTHAAIIQFDGEARMKGARFISAVIKSCRRYTYEEAMTRLSLSETAAGDFEDPVEKRVVAHVRRAWKLAAKLRERRFKEGCFDLDFPEVRVVLDADGIAFGVKKTEHDESHQLIEEFMIAANEAVARETKNASAPSIYRIHEDPDLDRLDEFADLARSFGYKIGDPSVRFEIQKLTRAVKGKLEEQSLKIALLKSMKRAAYSNLPIGHYGLAKANYCHFTSPIRRYADLVVHRSLMRIMSRRGEPSAPRHPDSTPPEAGVAEIGAHLSRTERVAADAERDSQQLKMIEYLENLIRGDADTTFLALVNEVRPVGLFIELKDLMIRGMIRKVDLPPRDDYYFDRSRSRFLSGRRKGVQLGVGSTVEVRLVRIDRSRGFLDFAPV